MADVRRCSPATGATTGGVGNVAWQLLGIARSAVTRDRHDHARQIHTRLQALEHLHHTDDAAADHDRPGTP